MTTMDVILAASVGVLTKTAVNLPSATMLGLRPARRHRHQHLQHLIVQS